MAGLLKIAPLAVLASLALGQISFPTVDSGTGNGTTTGTVALPFGPSGALRTATGPNWLGDERYSGIVPNNFNGGGFITGSAASTTTGNKEITYAADEPIFIDGELPQGVPTSVAVHLQSTAGSCLLTRLAGKEYSASTILTLSIPTNVPNCLLTAGGTVQPFIIPAQWLAPNPKPGVVTVTVSATNNAQATTQYSVFPQVIVPPGSVSSSSLGPSGNQLTSGIQPVNWQAAPFTPTNDVSSGTDLVLALFSNRAIFQSGDLPNGSPSTTMAYLFPGAAGYCTLTRHRNSTNFVLWLELQDNSANCAFQQKASVQPFFLPQAWLLPNPVDAAVLVGVATTGNGLATNLGNSTVIASLPQTYFGAAYAMYVTTDFAQVTCANVNQYFQPGPVNAIDMMTDSQRAALAQASTTPTVCDYPAFHLSIVPLPATALQVSMPANDVIITVVSWGSVPPVARAVVLSYPPVQESFGILGVPVPSTNNIQNAATTIVGTATSAVTGASGLFGSTVGGAVGTAGGAVNSATGSVTGAVTDPIASRKLLFIMSIDRFQMDGVMANGSPMAIEIYSPYPIGLILTYVQGMGWVGITQLGSTVTYSGSNKYVVRGPLHGAIVGYGTLPFDPEEEGSNNDALLGFLVLLVIPVLCCCLLVYLCYRFLMKRRRQQMVPIPQVPCCPVQELHTYPAFGNCCPYGLGLPYEQGLPYMPGTPIY